MSVNQPPVFNQDFILRLEDAGARDIIFQEQIQTSKLHADWGGGGGGAKEGGRTVPHAMLQLLLH